MTLFIADPQGNIVAPLGSGTWARFPDGDFTSNLKVGYTSTGGFTIVKLKQDEKPAPQFTREERVRLGGVPAYPLLETLSRRGLYRVARSEAARNEITLLFFERAPVWFREGGHEKAILGGLTVNGKALTDAQIDDIFMEALGE